MIFILVSFCLLWCWPGGTARGQDARGAGLPSHRPELYVGPDGMVVECRDASCGKTVGPFLPGEIHYQGSFVPGLLQPRQWRQLQAQLPAHGREDWAQPDQRAPRTGLLVMLDPGHGGKQMGAIGITGLVEKDLVLDVAIRVRKLLQQVEGVEVVMTRERDQEVALWQRVIMANQVRADLFISIHANAFSRASLGGVETFFHSLEASGEEAKRVASFENAIGEPSGPAVKDTLDFILQDMREAERLRDSSRLAHLVQKSLAAALPLENRGVMQADFIVLRGTRMASVLLELGFLTHALDEKTLRSSHHRQNMAAAIQQGVLSYWRLQQRKHGAPKAEVSKK